MNNPIFKTRLENITNPDDFKTLVSEIKSAKNDNSPVDVDYLALSQKVKVLNENSKTVFCNMFFSILDSDRKTAFETLIVSPTYPTISINEDLEVKDGFQIFKFSDLESKYQVLHYVDTDNSGKPKANTNVTIFGATRFQGLCESFIRNLFMAKTKQVVESRKLDLSRVSISDTTIFTANDGDCFKSNSNNDLEKQMNILIKFIGIDIMLKKSKCLESLKDFSMKYSVDKKTVDINGNIYNNREVKYLKFMDDFWKYVTMEYLDKMTKVYTSDGKEVNDVKPAKKSKTTKSSKTTEPATK